MEEKWVSMNHDDDDGDRDKTYVPDSESDSSVEEHNRREGIVLLFKDGRYY